MASPPTASRGWTASFAALEAVAAKGSKAAREQTREQADIGLTWTLLTNTVFGVVPPALTRARGHASRMMQAVR